MKFYIETLGCKVNQFEAQALERVLTARGHSLGKPGGGCDVCVINTCAVTGESARKSRQAVRRLRKLEPDALIAVCGCLSQLEPESVSELGAELVGGSGDRLGFAEELERLSRDGCRIIGDDPALRRVFEELPSGGARSRTRALLKIQDGCDNFCAYCVIPYARGRVRSLPVLRAAESARALERGGYREIVITGIEISSYGKDLENGATLIDAVQAISDAAPGVRLRLGSLEPRVVTGAFCEKLGRIPKLCAHFHISLQSGSDATLRRMRRRYGTIEAYGAIEALRRQFPGCGVTADLITGFPGETDAEFAETLEFITRAAFSNMHIFPFSARPGTAAAAMPDQLEKRVIRARAAEAARVAEVMAGEFKRNQAGKTLEVLFERRRDGFWTGHTENYIEVSVRHGGGRNEILPVKIMNLENGTLWGEVLPSERTF